MKFFPIHTITDKEDLDTRREMLVIDHEAQAWGDKLHAERRKKHKQCYAEKQYANYKKHNVPMVSLNLGIR